MGQPSIEQPLAGVRVVEFSTMITASLATMMFAQQGADVIKIEPEGIGDIMRHVGTQKSGISALFNNCNRSKRSIALDLKNPEDVATAKKLCLNADVVISNYRPGVMDRLGLGSEVLRSEKPALVYAAISGFGTTGPMASSPAYDHVVQAMSGLMDNQGDGSGFAYVKMAVCDKLTAYTAAQAITAALFARERTGQGQYLELSMLHSCLAFLWPDGMMHDTLQGEGVVHMLPFQSYYQSPIMASDGALAFAAASDAQWESVMSILGREELMEDPRFNNLAARSQNMDALIQEVAGRPFARTSAELLAACAERDVPAAPCIRLDQIKSNEQFLAIEAIEKQDHPLLGEVHNVAAPVYFDGKKPPPSRPSPALGQHTDEILAELENKA